MCWTSLYTRNKTNTNKIKKNTHNTICVGHHYTQETRRIQTKLKKHTTQYVLAPLCANKHI